MDTSADVLANRARWSCEHADAIQFLMRLPDDSVDLLFTSPPYLMARTYGIEGAAKPLGQWVEWMANLVAAARPKVKGLIAINCEGQTRGYSYQPAPFLLMARLHAAGFTLRKPVVFHRVGIPGSGGPDWLRNDWEPVICCTRPGRLPWSEPTAAGRPPKFGTGGSMSNRTADGKRINAGLARRHQTCGNGRRRPMPDIANPGNVVRCVVGGKRMGHELASENEAPFPLKLAAFFVRSFCPPGGVTCDPFSGSGTTCHAAVEHGRRFVGCDVRASQVDLIARRMATVTPDLF